MLKTRLLTAFIGGPIVLLLAWLGRPAFDLFIWALALGGYAEYLNLARKHLPAALVLPGGLLLAGLLAMPYVDEPMLFPFLALFVLVLIAVWEYPRYPLEAIAYNVFGALYFGFLLQFGLRLIVAEHHFALLLLALFVAWGNDVGGYFAGRQWGRRKLAPQLSPKKTIAGSVGGLLTAAAVVLIFAIFAPPLFSWGAALAIIFLGSLAAQGGDLFISLVKRTFGAKDTGRLLPGHGGLLDRFDSLMLVLPIIYFFCR
jgi:phosphatidate cytidylyltransferase